MVIAADRYGKWKTVLQIVAIVPLLIHYSFWGLPVHGVGIFILYIALILTIISGVNYFYRFTATGACPGAMRPMRRPPRNIPVRKRPDEKGLVSQGIQT